MLQGKAKANLYSTGRNYTELESQLQDPGRMWCAEWHVIVTKTNLTKYTQRHTPHRKQPCYLLL